MTMLNLRFQHDTPNGVLDIHAFVTDQEDGQYLVYCRKGHDEPITRVVTTFSQAVACLREIINRIETEVTRCSSLPCALTM
jgi:hypothetical protein